MPSMQSKERFSSIKTTTCSMSAGTGSALRFGIFEANVTRAADGHQRKQGVTEIGHGEVTIDTEEKHGAQDAGPAEDLEAMQGAPVQVGGQILEPARGDEGFDGIIVRAQHTLPVEDFGMQVLGALLLERNARRELSLAVDDFLPDPQDIGEVVQPQCAQPAISVIGGSVLVDVDGNRGERGGAGDAH